MMAKTPRPNVTAMRKGLDKFKLTQQWNRSSYRPPRMSPNRLKDIRAGHTLWYVIDGNTNFRVIPLRCMSRVYKDGDHDVVDIKNKHGEVVKFYFNYYIKFWNIYRTYRQAQRVAFEHFKDEARIQLGRDYPAFEELATGLPKYGTGNEGFPRGALSVLYSRPDTYHKSNIQQCFLMEKLKKDPNFKLPEPTFAEKVMMDLEGIGVRDAIEAAKLRPPVVTIDSLSEFAETIKRDGRVTVLDSMIEQTQGMIDGTQTPLPGFKNPKSE